MSVDSAIAERKECKKCIYFTPENGNKIIFGEGINNRLWAFIIGYCTNPEINGNEKITIFETRYKHYCGFEEVIK